MPGSIIATAANRCALSSPSRDAGRESSSSEPGDAPVASASSPSASCDRATIVLVEEGSGNPLMQFTHASLPPGRDEGPPDQVIRAGLTTERAVALNVPKASTVLDSTLGVRSHVVLVPLQGEDHKLGLLALERLPSRAKFEDSDLRLATIAGAQIANFLRSVA